MSAHQLDLTWPTRLFSELFHVGTLKAKDKGTTHNARSLEGAGLSVSRHPNAWRKIARLGGAIYEMRSREPAAFIDALALQPAHRTLIQAWGLEQGFIKPTDIAELSWYDSERDDRIYIRIDASEPARLVSVQDELAELEDLDGVLTISPGFIGTPALASRIGYAAEPLLVEEMLLTIYAEDVLYKAIGAHGVWWSELLDVSSLSAPRGVIHLQALASWSAAVSGQTLASDASEEGESGDADQEYDQMDLSAAFSASALETVPAPG